MHRFFIFRNTGQEYEPIQAKLLYAEFGERKQAYQINRHVHSYWQIEMVISGKLKAEVEGINTELDAGDAIIIPPNCWHCFRYEDQMHYNWSLKFKIDNLEYTPGDYKTVREQLECKVILAQLEEWKQQNKSTLPFKQLEYLLASLIDNLYRQQRDGQEPDFAIKVREIIKAGGGRRVAASAVAKKLSYSENHLSAKFKQQLGVNLKSFIDLERLAIAKELLEYPELNISEIAEQMGFPDLFAFSRFFRRMNGESPKKYRKKILPTLDKSP